MDSIKPGRYFPRGKTRYPFVQALRFCTDRKRCICITILFLHHGTRRCEGTAKTPRPLFSTMKEAEQLMEAPRACASRKWYRGIAVLSLDYGTRRCEGTA